MSGRLFETIIAEMSALDPDGYRAESAAEIIGQYESECAQFGDAGPGQGIAAGKARAFLRQLGDLAREAWSTPEYGPPNPDAWGAEEPF